VLQRAVGEIRDYRDLKVWQLAIELAPLVYRLVKRLPQAETYAMGDQMRRAAVSISANIAEGQARQHTREFLQHLCIARGSLAELDSLFVISERLGYLPSAELNPLRDQMGDLRRSLYGLTSALKSKLRATTAP